MTAIAPCRANPEASQVRAAHRITEKNDRMQAFGIIGVQRRLHAIDPGLAAQTASTSTPPLGYQTATLALDPRCTNPIGCGQVDHISGHA